MPPPEQLNEPPMDFNEPPPEQFNEPPMDFNEPPPEQFNEPPPQEQFNEPPPEQFNEPPPQDFGNPPPDGDMHLQGSRQSRSLGNRVVSALDISNILTIIRDGFLGTVSAVGNIFIR